MIELIFVTYNRLDYTRQSLQRLLADPTEEFEVSIWDNASTDGTREYLSSEVTDGRVKEIVFSKENVGQTVALNTVWGRSRADLLGKVDNDCLVTPGWTRSLASAHSDIKNLGVVACWHFFPSDFDFKRAEPKIQRFGNHQLLRHPWTCGSGLLVKRSVFEEFGPIREKATTQYWLRMARSGYVNGFYFPLILQEHMDDPKSEYSHLKDETSYRDAKKVTFSLNCHGQETLADRWAWRERVIANLLDDPWEAKYYCGWRGKLRSAVGRINRVAGVARRW